MNSNKIYSKVAKCPYALGKIGKQPYRLQCSGYFDNTALSMEFWSNSQRANHYFEYCADNFERCPLFKSIYNFRKFNDLY